MVLSSIWVTVFVHIFHFFNECFLLHLLSYLMLLSGELHRFRKLSSMKTSDLVVNWCNLFKMFILGSVGMILQALHVPVFVKLLVGFFDSQQ